MIEGARVNLRPMTDDDWPILERWARTHELWGDYQRVQLDHLPLLRTAHASGRLLSRESALLLVETTDEGRVVGFVRHAMSAFPDQDLPHPDIGFGVEAGDRGKGYATEAVGLLVGYLFAGHPAQRITAATDRENLPARRVLENVGFTEEGVLRRALFRDGAWRDVALYGLLRQEWTAAQASRPNRR